MRLPIKTISAAQPISKRIKLLEDRLGVKLLVRGPRQVRATEAGRSLLQTRQGVTGSLQRTGTQRFTCTRETLTGTLRVNVPLSFGLTKLGEPVVSVYGAASGNDDPRWIWTIALLISKITITTL